MTTGVFNYISPTSYTSKPWSKVDGPIRSFTLAPHPHSVSDIRTAPSPMSTDTSGFSLLHSPAPQTPDFSSDEYIRGSYYDSITSLLKTHLGASRVEIFDHTIRKHDPLSARQPVQQVHVDQTPSAAAARVRRHLGSDAESLLKGRYQIVNVWRPIGHPASDYPLAVIDWRSTSTEDFIPVDLLYPKREDNDDDDRGKEVLPDAAKAQSTDGYEVKGETYAVKHADGHRFWYAKDMTPEEVLLLKCFDSRSRTITGEGSVAHGTPHTAFVDPQTPAEAKGRQSIEVRCLVFYD